MKGSVGVVVAKKLRKECGKYLKVWLRAAKETTLERADFTLQLLMFVTAEKERRMSTRLTVSLAGTRER